MEFRQVALERSTQCELKYSDQFVLDSVNPLAIVKFPGHLPRDGTTVPFRKRETHYDWTDSEFSIKTPKSSGRTLSGEF